MHFKISQPLQKKKFIFKNKNITIAVIKVCSQFGYHL